MSFHHQIATASSHRHSDDRVLVIERRHALVIAIADGAGGMRGGAAASDTFIRAVEHDVNDEAFDVHDSSAWRALLSRVDHDLARVMTGETTAIVIAVSAQGVTGASVGDSEAWLVGASTIDDLTTFQDRRRLGSGGAVPTSFSRPPLASRLLTATDGLFKYASPTAIAEATRSDSTDALLAIVRLPSGRYPDDVALALLTPT